MVESNPFSLLPQPTAPFVRNCTNINLSNQKIKYIRNFEGFTHLENLWMNDNEITELEGLEQCVRLRLLSLNNNYISKININCFSNNKHLSKLFLMNNHLRDLDSTLEALEHLKLLKELDLRGNPLIQVLNYRQIVISFLPQLEKLDCMFTHVDKKQNTNKDNTKKQNKKLPSVYISEDFKTKVKQIQEKKKQQHNDNETKKSLFLQNNDNLNPNSSNESNTLNHIINRKTTFKSTNINNEMNEIIFETFHQYATKGRITIDQIDDVLKNSHLASYPDPSQLQKFKENQNGPLSLNNFKSALNIMTWIDKTSEEIQKEIDLLKEQSVIFLNNGQNIPAHNLSIKILYLSRFISQLTQPELTVTNLQPQSMNRKDIMPLTTYQYPILDNQPSDSLIDVKKYQDYLIGQGLLSSNVENVVL